MYWAGFWLGWYVLGGVLVMIRIWRGFGYDVTVYDVLGGVSL